MKKTLNLHRADFVSSSQKTPQYKTFHRTFKREFTKALTDMGCRDIKIGKANHFDVSGFFTSPGGQVWYFSISDLRWSKDQMLIRTAQHDRDFTGGHNQYIKFDSDILINVSRKIKE